MTAPRQPVDGANAVFLRPPIVDDMGERMRARRATLIAVLSVAVSLVTTGCVNGAGQPKPSTRSTENRTLVEAIDAYTRYSAAFDVVRSQPPKEADSASLEASVTEEYWTVLQAELKADERDWLQRGSSTFGGEQLMPSKSEAADGHIVMSVCVDLTHTALVDADGSEIPAPDRRLVFPAHVTLERGTANSFLVSDVVALAEDEACGS